MSALKSRAFASALGCTLIACGRANYLPVDAEDADSQLDAALDAGGDAAGMDAFTEDAFAQDAFLGPDGGVDAGPLPTLTIMPSSTVTFGVLEARFGTSIALADVNGDRFDDLVVGAPQMNGTQSQEGAVYVYLGNASGRFGGIHREALPTRQANANFGTWVANAGDVDGNGCEDIVVGAPGWDSSGASDVGRAYLYLGAIAGLAVGPAWTANPTVLMSARFGSNVQGVGDVTGDGLPDVAIASANREGIVYVFAGEGAGSLVGLSATAAFTAAPPDVAGRFFGFAISGGRVDADASSDLLISAYTWSTPLANQGAAMLFRGGVTLTDSALRFTGDAQMDAHVGSDVLLAGDLNGDRFGDAVVGAFGWESAGTTQADGRVYVLNGNATGLASMPSVIESPDSDAAFGFRLAAGNFQGDARREVAVTAIFAAPGGAAFVYETGPSGLASTPRYRLTQTQAGAQLGSSVAMGDINGDGHDDVVLGAAFDDTMATNAGAVHIYLGRP